MTGATAQAVTLEHAAKLYWACGMGRRAALIADDLAGLRKARGRLMDFERACAAEFPELARRARGAR